MNMKITCFDCLGEGAKYHDGYCISCPKCKGKGEVQATPQMIMALVQRFDELCTRAGGWDEDTTKWMRSIQNL